MANNKKTETVVHQAMQYNVDKLGLGVRKTSETPDVLLTGATVDAGGDMSTAGATKAIVIEIGGTTYYIPAFDANS